MHMTRFIIRRLIATAFILVFLSIAVFTLIRVMPGQTLICEGFCPPGRIEADRIERGLDKPYFPVSLDLSRGQDWWLLAVPAAGAAIAYAALRRRSPDTP